MPGPGAIALTVRLLGLGGIAFRSVGKGGDGRTITEIAPGMQSLELRNGLFGRTTIPYVRISR
jgi:hypothetical protein